MSIKERKHPVSKVDRHNCKCPIQDQIHGKDRRVWNPRVSAKTGRHYGWTCTGCGLKERFE